MKIWNIILLSGANIIESANLPGIICWNIWKIYTNILWGSSLVVPNICHVIWNIKPFTQNWALSLSTQRFGKIDFVLFEERLFPKGFKVKQKLFKPFSWMKSKIGMKLNIDAAFIPDSASGGVILRNQSGELICATAFPASASLSLEAEFLAVTKATRWAIQEGYRDFLVEIDAEAVLDFISTKQQRSFE
ncbi:unnamed protein product [Cuscuta europaea]|uniref:RNase H type-1 domain-containing protein n=1 Tax=Cuscuta europaea TaxID=41803 RepID=A0A9P0ZMD7_CUSEU|nr:unnamed protein product [Cuscuta europaea]